MIDMFTGEFHHNLDAKGRLILPSKFRDELQETVMITIGLDGCLKVYTMASWQKIYEKLMTLPTTSRDARIYVRMVIGKACECTFDSQGRILIPANLIKEASITKETVVVGVGDCLEIWSADRWNATLEEGIENFEAIAERLSSFGI